MSSDEVAISVQSLSKTYRLFAHPGDRVRQFLSLGLKHYHREFLALDDVSFDIKKGETVGVIGPNGSGKSTLLQLICGILKPSSGTVDVNGRLSALLELGAGFNPEFTGKENVFFQGALMGLSVVQMQARLDRILSFADIGTFIDQPVRTYSSGMFVRLAFSVAIHLDPDILIIDEALAVGDNSFQARCFRRIDDIRGAGGTILVVTHSMEQVAHHCDRALLLDKGRLLADGDTTTTLAKYLQKASIRSQHSNSLPETPITGAPTDGNFSNHPAYNVHEVRWGDRRASIVSIRISQDDDEVASRLAPGRRTHVELRVTFHCAIEQPIYGLAIKSSEGVIVFSTNSLQLLGANSFQSTNAGDRVVVCFSLNPYLDSGTYSLSVGVASMADAGICPHDRRYDSILLSIDKPLTEAGDIDMNASFVARYES